MKVYFAPMSHRPFLRSAIQVVGDFRIGTDGLVTQSLGYDLSWVRNLQFWIPLSLYSPQFSILAYMRPTDFFFRCRRLSCLEQL